MVLTDCRFIYQRRLMLGLIIAFLILAIIAGFFGFGGVAVASAGFAKILFYIFIVLFLGSLIMRLLNYPTRPPL